MNISWIFINFHWIKDWLIYLVYNHLFNKFFIVTTIALSLIAGSEKGKEYTVNLIVLYIELITVIIIILIQSIRLVVYLFIEYRQALIAHILATPARIRTGIGYISRAISVVVKKVKSIGFIRF